MIEAPFAELALGDVITVSSGRTYSVRDVASWGAAVADLIGFVLLGELDVLLGVPDSERPVDVFLPVDRFPASAGAPKSAAEGAVRYWAPHLPAQSDAMGELLWRLVVVPGRLDPVFIVYRGEEAVVFVRSFDTPPSTLKTQRMGRGSDDTVVPRFSGSLTPVPAYVPAEALYEQLTRR